MKTYRVEVELVIEAYNEEHIRDIVEPQLRRLANLPNITEAGINHVIEVGVME